jgi:hypothetical protein
MHLLDDELHGQKMYFIISNLDSKHTHYSRNRKQSQYSSIRTFVKK